MKLQRTKYDVIVNLICILLLVGILIYLGLNWSSIPDKIPGHYNALGVVDRWGNKGELIYSSNNFMDSIFRNNYIRKISSSMEYWS